MSSGPFRAATPRHLRAATPLTPQSGIRPPPPAPHASYVPPRPAFDSEPQLTRVTAPDPSLLALTRDDERKRRRRGRGPRAGIVGFALGVICGALAVWSVTSDVRSDVFRAREWLADELRALHSDAPADPAIAPASVVTDAPPIAAAPSAAAAPAGPTAPAPAPAPVPTIDVGQLPRVAPAPATAPR